MRYPLGGTIEEIREWSRWFMSLFNDSSTSTITGDEKE